MRRGPVDLGGHRASHLRDGVRVAILVAETLTLRLPHPLDTLPHLDTYAVLEARLLLGEAIDYALYVARKRIILIASRSWIGIFLKEFIACALKGVVADGFRVASRYIIPFGTHPPIFQKTCGCTRDCHGILEELIVCLK